MLNLLKDVVEVPVWIYCFFLVIAVVSMLIPWLMCAVLAVCGAVAGFVQVNASRPPG